LTTKQRKISMAGVNTETCGFCFLDLDINNQRQKLATAAAFVDAKNLAIGLSSNNLLALGGSEVSRLKESIAIDHEWASKDTECGGIATRSPSCGNRIVIRLFWDVAPLACENFSTLCSNGSLLPGQTGKPKPIPIGESGKPLTYRGCNMHRCIPDFVLQGGDFVKGNGSGGESIFKKTFKDEKAGLNLKHDRCGLVSMGNSGKNSNTSQFFFTLAPTPKLDGKHVIFGEIVSGVDVLKSAEKFGTKDGNPSVPITITDCGIFEPLRQPGAGFWYDKPDADSWNGVSPTFVVRPRLAILAPTESVLQKIKAAAGSLVSISLSVCADSCDDNEETQASILMESLANFASDLVVIAPACKGVITKMDLPKSWIDNGIVLEEVILVAKPLETIEAIRQKSWLAKHRSEWQLDGSS
jgi:cyclophilin family peptidyl-prolyl cis-trans isomerase